MSLKAALASTLHLFVVLAFFSAGLFCISLSYFPTLQIQIADIVQSRSDICILAGIILFFVSLLLLLGFYCLNRGQFLRLAMGRHLAEIDAKILRDTIEDCLQRQFPDQILLQDLEVMWGRKLEISIALTSEKEPEELLAKAEKELTELLRHRFGYTKPFAVVLRR